MQEPVCQDAWHQGPRSDPGCLELQAVTKGKQRVQARAHTAMELLVTALGELEQVQQKVEQVQQRADLVWGT